ncbi:MAG TPA: DUF2804 domain-containing protein [Spirochaetia bacterium]|nr:DUF2804 domain-containing protein [Spirochaetales bacterium]HOT58193.1 DUF2804 domain-containing protein [Spirochaetales bacterium]HPD80771.1 DUF2804 domain-containing protein [Spirochaetales bacterium]HQK35779.1 DUF2804 domain-containing protein [Spirochaetales bacterium]HRS64501.1 DUF2804 domain-containing protein [Spirochaetia bacterium]
MSDEQQPYSRELTPAPVSVVQNGKLAFGCYTGIIAETDITRANVYNLPQFIKKSRCKAWRALQIGTPRWFIFIALYEARLLGMGFAYIWDKASKKFYAFKHSRLFSGFGITGNMDGETIGYTAHDSCLHCTTDLYHNRIIVTGKSVSRANKPSMAFSFSLNLGDKHAAPMSVILPFSSSRGMYSMKCMMPADGWIQVNGERCEVKPEETLAMFDDHKGMYPYQMRYNWVTGFGFDSKGRKIGINLTENQVIQQNSFNENVLWINNKLIPLPPIKITKPEGVYNPWHIQDLEGLVDLMFIPERNNKLAVNALVAKLDYYGPFGSFSGTLKTPDGDKIDPTILYGMGEQKYLRV